MSKNTGDGELDDIRALDTIQRNIWARINDEVNLRGIKLSIGDAYALGSVIKEVLHPEVKKYAAQEANKAREGEINHFLDLFSTALLPHQIRYLRQRLAQLTKEKESSDE